MDIKAFALTRPKAPEMLTLDPSDVEAHGGASIKDTETKPFEVVMLSYQQQAKGDVIRLYLNGEFVDDETVIDEQAATSIFVRPGMFQKGLNRLKFHIERTSGNNEFTPKLVLLHRTFSPGGTPPALTLSVSHNSIGPGDANNVSVTVSYKNIQWYDRIFVDCNGARVQHQLLPDSTTPLPAAPKNIVIPIPRTALEDGGNDENFEFKFRVIDYLTNPSGPPTWSDSVSVDVHLDRLSLPMAVFREILSDNNDDPATVDLEKMNGGPLWAQVHLAETIWKSEDSIHLTFTAERAGAVVGTYEQTFDNREPKTNVTWEIPNSKVIADSTVKVVYELIRKGNVIATSDAAVAAVTGAGSTELPPPFLVPPAQSPLDVLAYRDGVKMRIDYPGAQQGDRARLVEVNAPAGAPQFPLVAFNSNKRVNVPLTAAYLAARHGKELEYRWNLNRGGGQAGKSPAVKVSVGRIVDGDERLPMPNVEGELGTDLDIDKLSAGANILVARWLFQVKGAPTFLTLSGVNENGVTTNEVLKGEPASSDNGLTIAAPIEWLHNLKSDSELKITFSTTPYLVKDLANTTIFPERVYNTKLAPKILTENFDIIPNTNITTGHSLDLESMTISYIDGDSVRIAPSANNSGIEKQALTLSGAIPGVAMLTLKSPCSKVTFRHFHGVYAKFFSSDNMLIEERTIYPNGFVEFSAPNISKIELRGLGAGSGQFDNFMFYK
ncbi:Uncharacterised protein [Pseudomonas fluorescens]|uniref:Uncharacterized protein n=1 Tax=Pseudomonas fluorescens TaxID=294 RepID=A0A3S4PFG0_PSEFL|nr:hypothetical protein [Pseudomonas fluorescens]VEF10520.1 Uncharacterised protein [Pseudomonas fluorescens]